MNNKILITAIMLVLFVLHGQELFAQSSSDFLQQAGRNDFTRMERLLERRNNNINLNYCASEVLRGVSGLQQNNIIPVLELLRRYGAVFNESMFNTALERNRSDDVIIYLINNISFRDNSHALSDVFFRRRSDVIIQLLIDKGIRPQWNTIRAAIQARNYKWVSTIISLGGSDINANDNSIREEELGMELGQTPLMVAANVGSFEIVQLLIENGARVNLRDPRGRTAASIAYDKGEIEIYNYLKENGAIDFEPMQVTQTSTPQTSSSTNVYIQPSSPTQSTPVPSAPTLQTGRYAWTNSGTNMTMTLGAGGMVTAYLNSSPIGVWHGTYRVNGNQVIITITNPTSDFSQLRGQVYTYTINSSTSFSSSAETWVRTGSF